MCWKIKIAVEKETRTGIIGLSVTLFYCLPNNEDSCSTKKKKSTEGAGHIYYRILKRAKAFEHECHQMAPSACCTHVTYFLLKAFHISVTDSFILSL